MYGHLNLSGMNCSGILRTTREDLALGTEIKDVDDQIAELNAGKKKARGLFSEVARRCYPSASVGDFKYINLTS